MNTVNNSLDVYTSLFVGLYTDLTTAFLSDGRVSIRDVRLDIRRIRYRLGTEGISFLTKTLPSYGKAFDNALSHYDVPMTILGLKKRPGTEIPKLFGCLFKLVIDYDGLPLYRDESDAQAVYALRQLLYVLYKLELPYAPETEVAVLDRFIANDLSLAQKPIDPNCYLIRKARVLITSLFSGLTHKMLADIVPGHGPGSVSTGQREWQKYEILSADEKLRDVYSDEYFRSSINHLLDSPEILWEQQNAKCVYVPKDSRGPRLISCEPLATQYIQQGLKNLIVPWIESHRLTKGRVNFTDQTINQRLAMQGSIDRSVDTLDLEDASDLVSLNLVQELFRGTILMPYLLAARTSSTRLPGSGDLLTLNKFAPMGSALCFPIEALCFWALASAVIHYRTGDPLRKAARRVYVYGDDIIVPAKNRRHITRYFADFGLKTNERKCCDGESFRESCGVDAFNGVNVTPTRIKTVWVNHRDPKVLASYIALRNRCLLRGFFSVVERLDELLTHTYGFIPYSCGMSPEEASSRLLRWDDTITLPAALKLAQMNGVRYRLNAKLHVVQYKTWTVRAPRCERTSDDYAALGRYTIRPTCSDLKSFSPSGESLATITPRDQLKLARGWVQSTL